MVMKYYVFRTDTPIEPNSVSISDINSNPELYEGTLIKISRVDLSTETPWLGGGSSFRFKYEYFVGVDTLILRVDADTDIWELPLLHFHKILREF